MKILFSEEEGNKFNFKEDCNYLEDIGAMKLIRNLFDNVSVMKFDGDEKGILYYVNANYDDKMQIEGFYIREDGILFAYGELLVDAADKEHKKGDTVYYRVRNLL